MVSSYERVGDMAASISITRPTSTASGMALSSNDRNHTAAVRLLTARDRAYLVRSEPTTRRFDGKYKLDGWQYPHACVWKDALFIAYSINKEDLGVTRISLDDLPL